MSHFGPIIYGTTHLQCEHFIVTMTNPILNVLEICDLEATYMKNV